MPDILTKQFRTLRKQLGSQVAVAKLLRVSTNWIAHREQGQRSVRYPDVLALMYLVYVNQHAGHHP